MKRIFDWDPQKDAINRKKHRVSFEEAVTIFLDPYILSKYDEEHSELEDRWVSLGCAGSKRLLLVIHTERVIEEGVEIFRLISARRASKLESEFYNKRRPI